MKRRVVLINVLIFAGVVIFATRFRSAWESFEQGNSLEGIVATAQQNGGSAGPSPVESMGRPGPFSEFVVVSQKTLFAESRRSESQEEVVAQDPEVIVEEPPKWAARPMLHGVSAVGSRRLGVMTVFEGKQKTGELRNVEVGDLVQGYWVDEIGETTIRLRWGDRDEIIDMADATKPAAAGRSGAAGKVTVINVGSAPSAVETTSAATEPEGSSLEVSVVSAPSGQGGGRQAGAAGRQGAAQPARQPAGQEAQQDEGVQRFIEGR
jgi:hypothetical protein